jgi:hypothetical protein
MQSKAYDLLLASLANFCTVATAIGAIVISLTARTTPQLSYTVNPVRTIIGDPTRSRRIEMRVQGRAATVPIMAAQVLIFNDGRYAIDSKDFTPDPLRIVTGPRTALIDATVQKATRPAATLFHVTADDSHLAAGEVPIGWNFLEEDDAAVVQLIYAARQPDITIGLAGTIKGQKKLREVLIDRAAKMNEVRSRGIYLSILVLIDVLLLAGTFYASVTRRSRLTIYYGLAFFCVTSAVVWVVAYIAFTPHVPLRF